MRRSIFPGAWVGTGPTAFLAACILVPLGGCKKETEPAGPTADASSAAASAQPDKPNVPSTYIERDLQGAKEVVSPVYHVDQLYRSMMGPQSTRQFQLVGGDAPELVYVTGFEATMVGADAEEPIAQEFMCHSNLDIDPTLHNGLFGADKPFSGRLFTLSQGQFDIDFPKGFGIPLLSSEAINLTTQVLNLNDEKAKVDVRHRVQVKYVREDEAKVPVKPLFVAGIYGLKLIEGDDGYFGVEHPNEDEHGTGCLIGERASEDQFMDAQGRQFTGHWVVKPGREENRTLVTNILNLPFDTRVHYIAIHLHPFAETLELLDRTTGETVYKAKARQFPGKIGLAHVDYYASEEGLPLYKDHEYELISTYNNTTDEDQDSMAVMLLYMHDKQFKHPIETGIAKAYMEGLEEARAEAAGDPSQAPENDAAKKAPMTMGGM